jgi:serine/threonine protein kinase
LDGTIVAVKCINALAADAVDEFVTEVEIVSSLSHRNIVRLIGYGFGSDCYYLVYNFAPEGNLEHKLHGRVVFLNPNAAFQRSICHAFLHINIERAHYSAPL